MKRSMIAVMSVVAMVLVAANRASADGISIEVFPSSAPNGYGSPSFSGYQSNAIYAIENGLIAYGDPTLPTYYQVAPSLLSISQNIVTGFPSWQGNAGPSGVFASEYGNRLHFGVHILGNGTRFRISDLSFSGSSSDASNTLAFSYAGGYGYGPGYVGIDYGPNGVKGGGDDVIITSGLSTQLVDELVGRGSGNAWDVYDSSPGTTRQDKIDRATSVWWNIDDGLDYPLQPIPFDFTGTYTLGSVSGSASVSFVPEPGRIVGLLGLAGMGLIGLVWRRRRTA